MKKQFFLGLLSVFFASIVFSQNTDSIPTRLKKGLYFSYEEFIENSPSVEKPFVIVPNMVKLNKTDSGFNGYKYIVQDTVLKKKQIFAAYDGRNFFVGIKDALDYYTNSKILLPADSAARFPTLTYTVVIKPSSGFTPFMILDPASLIVSAIGTAVATASKTAIAMSQKEPESFQSFIYFNKKGKPINPNREAIGFLLRKDKDLELEFSKEKNMTIDVFKKYIRKMNERYPLNF